MAFLELSYVEQCSSTLPVFPAFQQDIIILQTLQPTRLLSLEERKTSDRLFLSAMTSFLLQVWSRYFAMFFLIYMLNILISAPEADMVKQNRRYQSRDEWEDALSPELHSADRPSANCQNPNQLDVIMINKLTWSRSRWLLLSAPRSSAEAGLTFLNSIIWHSTTGQCGETNCSGFVQNEWIQCDYFLWVAGSLNYFLFSGRSVERNEWMSSG